MDDLAKLTKELMDSISEMDSRCRVLVTAFPEAAEPLNKIQADYNRKVLRILHDATKGL